jgi:DNA gyrase inhibitor GyrI
MNRTSPTRWFLAALLLPFAGAAQAIEEPEFDVLRADGDIELRAYGPTIVAETTVTGDFEEASNQAFRALFKYIDGNNQAREEIAMTAPVAQERSEKIAMTAPVSQRAEGERWVVSFMMPAEYTMETLPEPLDSRVTLREQPPYRAAVIRYSGFWSEKNYLEHLEELQAWVGQAGLTVRGEPVWARYNAPFTPWFMRRNEILLRVD